MSYVLTQLSSEHRRYFASLKGSAGHLHDGIFIAEGPKVVEHILRSDVPVPYAFMTQDFFDIFEEVLSSRPGERTQLHLAPKEEMEKIVGFSMHQGVMLAARIPEQLALESIAAANSTRTVIVLEGIADAENMGTIIRTSAALGADAILVDRSCCHPFLRRSVRVSMGTVIDLPIVVCDDLHATLQILRSKGFIHIAAALTEGSEPLDTIAYPDRVTLLFGAEGIGLSEWMLGQADIVARVPMSRGIDSLNVGVACGIFLRERLQEVRKERGS